MFLLHGASEAGVTPEAREAMLKASAHQFARVAFQTGIGAFSGKDPGLIAAMQVAASALPVEQQKEFAAKVGAYANAHADKIEASVKTAQITAGGAVIGAVAIAAAPAAIAAGKACAQNPLCVNEVGLFATETALSEVTGVTTISRGAVAVGGVVVTGVEKALPSGKIVTQGVEGVAKVAETAAESIGATLLAPGAAAKVSGAVAKDATAAKGGQAVVTGTVTVREAEGAGPAVGRAGVLEDSALELAKNNAPVLSGSTVGEYSLVKPGSLSPNLAETFSGGRYKEIVLSNDTVLYRVGTKERPFGEFYSSELPEGVLQSRIDKAILPRWPNGAKSPIDSVFSIKIPAGTKVYVGEVSSQGGVFVGGTQQIVIPKAWSVQGAQVLEARPLK